MTWAWPVIAGAAVLVLAWIKRPAPLTGETVGGSVSSRNPTDLNPDLAQRWALAKAEFARRFPNLPQPFITQTYRSQAEQARLYAQGRTTPGNIVTYAQPGQSLHNYYPALAFDIAFHNPDGSVNWNENLFSTFAGIAKFYGLAWGGDWTGFKDTPHFEPPNYTWEMAQAGIRPSFGPIPS